MMNGLAVPRIDPELIATAVAAALSLCALLTAAITARAARRAQARCAALETALEALRRRIESAGMAQTRAAHRLKRLQAEHARLAERIGAVESRGDGRPFDQAIDSARRGATVTNLAERFGLSRGEADLVARLHGRTKG